MDDVYVFASNRKPVVERNLTEARASIGRLERELDVLNHILGEGSEVDLPEPENVEDARTVKALILDALRHGPLLAASIVERVQKHRRVTARTVTSVLSKLLKKKIVRRCGDGTWELVP